ncbi:MAG: phosphosulfolactate synthase [Promethearchaeota archaeon]
MKKLLNLPERAKKPREIGLTHVLDKAIGLSAQEDMLNTCAYYIDIVKIGWGLGVLVQHLKDKIDLYHKHKIPVTFGGTLFEVAYANNRLDEYKNWMKELGVGYMEISDGTITLSISEKLDFIKEFSKDFTVLSEFGSKDAATIVAPKEWVLGMIMELDAGAWKVIAEGRESGTSGLYRRSSEIRTGLVDELIDAINHEKIIWEAPQKSQQVWFIKKFGPNVNLGNIAPSEIIPLETLRLGLRGDTLLTFHGSKEK